MRNEQGENIGYPTTTPQSPVMTFDGSTAVTAAVASVFHTCAAVDKRVWCWGDNSNGLFGDGTRVSSATPVLVKGSFASPVRALASKSFNTCAVLENGEIWCWGDNQSLQSGVNDPTVKTVLTPARVDMGGRAVAEVVLGDRFGCARTVEGELLCWGGNEAGQLGVPGAPSTAKGIVVNTHGRRAVALSSTVSSACAVFDDGSSRCWGANVYGELATNDHVNYSAPQSVDLSGSAGAPIQIAGGREHQCARYADGSVKCWGKNSCWDVSGKDDPALAGGQLGLGDSLMRLTPQTVDLGGRKATSIAAGMDGTCASFDDGTVKCWGCLFWPLGEGEALPAADLPVATQNALNVPSKLKPVALGHAGSCEDAQPAP